MNNGLAVTLTTAAITLASVPTLGGSTGAELQSFNDPTGLLGIVNVNGATDTSNPFFQSLGTNGRSCATCHVASQGMSFSAAGRRRTCTTPVDAPALGVRDQASGWRAVATSRDNGRASLLIAFL